MNTFFEDFWWVLVLLVLLVPGLGYVTRDGTTKSLPQWTSMAVLALMAFVTALYLYTVVRG